jgi:hypothetical protein
MFAALALTLGFYGAVVIISILASDPTDMTQEELNAREREREEYERRYENSDSD